MPGIRPEQTDDRGRQVEQLRIVEQLRDELLRDILVVADAGHHHACGNGNDQRRDLRHQAIANGQQGVGSGRRADLHVVLQDADEQSADRR
jgi:hypothetical protein